MKPSLRHPGAIILSFEGQRSPGSYVEKAKRHRDAIAAQFGNGESSR